MARGFQDLNVYKLAYKLSQDVFHLTKRFPPEERYSLTDQIRRSARSIPANIAEGYRKKRYPRLFSLKMTEADGEVAETMVWIDQSRDCEYISKEEREELMLGYEEVGRMLHSMIDHPERFEN